jgi:hypothetical protein
VSEADLRKLICVCGHSAHWHAGVGTPGDPSGAVIQGAGECEDCDCSRFTQVPAGQPRGWRPVVVEPGGLR